MSSKQLPGRQSTDLASFLDQAEQLPQRASADTTACGRMIFALDATASRQPSWDRACHLQSRMFLATESIGGLHLQLCYYRSFSEFRYSHWVDSASELLGLMNGVQCLGGFTQIERVLDHALASHRARSIQALVFIGDAVEERVDRLCHKAGQLGVRGLPLFMFQEGFDPGARQCFQQMAHLSNGAYAAFDEGSADLLAELLSAAATFASGGFDALQQLQSAGAHQLLQQLKK